MGGPPGKIVERIGALRTGYWWGQGRFCLITFPGYLRCYEDGDVHFKGNIGNTPCNFVSTNEIDTYNILISPNPTNGSIYFSFSPLTSNLDFKVFDCLGRTLEQGTLILGETSFQIQLRAEQAGMLFVEFAAKGQTKTYKILMN